MSIYEPLWWWAALASLALVAAGGPFIIERLRRLKWGQAVRTDGPAAHRTKAGTPTMGGLLVTGVSAAVALVVHPESSSAWIAALGMLVYGSIGFLDDYRKIRTGASTGLKAREKLAGQVLAAAVLAGAAYIYVPGSSQWLVPFTSQHLSIPLWLFLPAAIFIVVGAANAVNLTDGLDGLASGTMAIGCLTLGLMALGLGQDGVGVLALTVAGACAGFLWHNAYPASVFMGDTGSLALGAVFGLLGILSGNVLFLPIIGVVFVVETLSVIVQVAYFRWTGGKRLFLMAPIHHHFELAGWPEPKVMLRMWLLSVAGAVMAMAAIVWP